VAPVAGFEPRGEKSVARRHVPVMRNDTEPAAQPIRREATHAPENAVPEALRESLMAGTRHESRYILYRHQTPYFAVTLLE
jgi:hypothetical protein